MQAVRVAKRGGLLSRRRRRGTYDELRDTINELYMQGVPVAVIAETFGLGRGVLASKVSDWGLHEVRAMRDRDLALDALEKWRGETTEEARP